MTHTLEIPKNRWSSVMEILNRHAIGRPVRLEVETMEMGDQELAIDLPLRELDFAESGSEAGGVMISLGNDRSDLRHVIADPDVLCIGYNESAELEWIAISGLTGSKTVIYFEDLLALPDHAEEGTPVTM